MKTIEEQVKEHMQNLAHLIEDNIPEKWGFIFMTYPHEREGELIYVSNSQRQDVVKALKEFIEKTESTYGNDTGKY